VGGAKRIEISLTLPLIHPAPSFGVSFVADGKAVGKARRPAVTAGFGYTDSTGSVNHRHIFS